MKHTTIILLLILSNLIYGQDFKVITIDPYLSFENYEHFKRLVLSSPDLYVDFIDDFEFEWGYLYKLKVKQTKLNIRQSDGTKFEFSLEKIISKTKVHDSTQFKLFLDGNKYYHKVESNEEELNKTFNKLNDSTFVYLDIVEIEVPAYLIEEMKPIVEGKTSIFGTFIFVDEKKNRIRLIKL
jgi:hypothetical protein